MNRRGIGMAVLVAGAGAAWRRKVARQLGNAADRIDPDPVTREPATPEPVTPAPVTDETPAVEIGSPEIGAPKIDDVTIAAPEIDAPEIDAPQIAAPEIDAPPAIVLPTMPLAGTNERPHEGVVVVPRADGSAPAQVAAPVGTVPEIVSKPLAIPEPAEVEPAIATPAPAPAPSPSPAPAPAVAALTQTPDTTTEAEKGPWYRRRYGGWNVLTLGLLSLIGVAAILAAVVRLPYYRLQPGSVYDTIERVEAPGDLVFIPDGEIGFVTVSQTANITAWQWLDAQLDESVRIRHEDEVRGDQTADEARASDLRRMQVSKSAAVVVALQKLGYELITTPVGVEVAQVFECTAADGSLGTGDLIVGVNGVSTPDGERLVEQLISIGIGQDVELLVERIDPSNPTQSMRTDLVGITLGSADDPCIEDAVRAEEPRPFIGIMTETMFEEELPIDIDIRTGRVGGPSAGLAFTLAIMDVLSEGELTNGLNIVATGTIDRNGSVGPVGGIHQKTIAAERSGADIFLVPMCCDNFVSRDDGEPIDLPSNFEEAQQHADDMLVVGVDNLDDALRAISELGGNVDQFLNQ